MIEVPEREEKGVFLKRLIRHPFRLSANTRFQNIDEPCGPISRA
jgi:hypothetical protein